MGVRSELDFASLLDELIEAAREREDVAQASTPELRVDLLDQIERLQTGSKEPGDEALRDYRSTLEDILAEAMDAPGAPSSNPMLEPALDDLFFLDPATIARELGIAKCRKATDFDKARRSFALRYHPDRVPEQMRERAKLRMQIANVLIDEAKRIRR